MPKNNQQDILIQGIPAFNINNRRYLGNKYRLLPFIRRVVAQNCRDIHIFADLFAGTGAVSSAFSNDCAVITNDILYSNYLTNLAWFSNEGFDEDTVADFINFYNDIAPHEENYMSENFADTYFSADDCRKIGFIRGHIEDSFAAGIINGRERALLVTSLMYAMDKIARTCGHYDAYRRGAAFDGHISLRFPMAPQANNAANICHNRDINELAPEVEADIIYLDPPYNSRQYCDAYHVLENVARWQQPELQGVARKMDRTGLKSDYCTRRAGEAFSQLVGTLRCRYILLSYNNMGTKGDDRSNARISDDEIMQALAARGRVAIFEEEHRPFSAGKSNIEDNNERLFLCTVE